MSDHPTFFLSCLRLHTKTLRKRERANKSRREKRGDTILNLNVEEMGKEE